MSNAKVSVNQLGINAHTITLGQFTDESITQFLHRIADSIISKVAPYGGNSPWYPSRDPDHEGALVSPSDDGGQHYTFSLLNSVAVTRCLVAADPANLIDTADLMHVVADTTNYHQRLLMLRIAARWNYAMFLKAEHILEYAPDAQPLPPLPNGQQDDHKGLVAPQTPSPRNRVSTNGTALVLVDTDTGRETPAELSTIAAPQPAATNTAEPVTPAPNNPQPTTRESAMPDTHNAPQHLEDTTPVEEPAHQNAPTSSYSATERAVLDDDDTIDADDEDDDIF